MSATLACMMPKLPMERPNCLRSCRYGSTASMQACMIPIGPPESTRRSESRPRMRMYAPPLTSPSTFSAGISQSSNTSSQVLEPRMPSLSSFCAVRNPGMSFSTRKAVMLFVPAAASAVRM